MTPKFLIKERFPVWQALSEFFLDKELAGTDYQWIAKTLSESPYTVDELKQILKNEVYPVCQHNAFLVAGVWSGFDGEWIKEKMAPRIGKKRFLGIPPLRSWIYRDHWKKVRAILQSLRAES